MKMDKNNNKYKFDFWGKMKNDPIFSQFVQDIIKKIVTVIIAFIGSFFVVKEVVIPIYDSMLEKREAVKEDVGDNRTDALINTSSVIIDTLSEEYQSYMAFRKDVEIYIKKEEEFEQLEKAPANSIDFGTVYYKKGIELLNFRKNIIEDMRLTAQKHNRQDLVGKINGLSFEMLTWEKRFYDCHLGLKSFVEEKNLEERTKEFLEKYNERIYTNDTSCAEKYELDIEDRRLMHDQQILMKKSLELIQMYHSEEYYRMEKRYYEVVEEYLQIVKKMIIQENGGHG